MSRDDVSKCQRCKGAGEEYRPELHLSDGPWTDCIACYGYGFEQTAESMRHFSALLCEAWRWDLPRYFKGDVECHDMRELADRDPSKPFGWLLRQTGSCLVVPEQWADSRVSLTSYLDARGHDAGTRVYWWDGATLQLVDFETLQIKMLSHIWPEVRDAA